MKNISLAVLLILIAGCCNSREYEIVRSPDCAYEPNSFVISEIPGQKLDIKSCLAAKFCSPDDAKFAKSLSDEVLNESWRYINNRSKHKTSILAAREIGDFILIFVDETNVADGGFEFVYSKKLKKVVGTFTAGYRG